MHAKETLALAKVITSKASGSARKELEAGTYSLDFTVRVTGTMDIHEDHDYTPTTSLSVKVLAALAIAGRGATEETFKAKLSALMEDAVKVANEGADPETAKLMKWVEEEMETVKGKLKALPKKTRKGKVMPSLVVARVERELTTGKLRKAVVSNPVQTEIV